VRFLSFPNNSHILVSDRRELLFKVNVELLLYSHIDAVRGIRNNLLISLKKKIRA
jgi:hypothetical protein